MTEHPEYPGPCGRHLESIDRIVALYVANPDAVAVARHHLTTVAAFTAGPPTTRDLVERLEAAEATVARVAAECERAEDRGPYDECDDAWIEAAVIRAALKGEQ